MGIRVDNFCLTSLLGNRLKWLWGRGQGRKETMYSRDNIAKTEGTDKCFAIVEGPVHLSSGGCFGKEQDAEKTAVRKPAGSCSRDSSIMPVRDMPDYWAWVQISRFPLLLPTCSRREFFSVDAAGSLWPTVHQPLQPPHSVPQREAKVQLLAQLQMLQMKLV